MSNRLISLIPALAAVMFLAVSCRKNEPSRNPEDHSFSQVMIFYGCGQNNLDYNIRDDIKEMTESEGVYLPSLSDDKAVVVCYHGCKVAGTYTESGTTYTIWIYRDPESDVVVRDTLARNEYTTIADPDIMRTLLENVRNKFKADRYGIVFSSHGTGWMPQGSYLEEEVDDDPFWVLAVNDGETRDKIGTPRDRQPLSSFGQERVGNTDYYMDVPDMAVSFPMKMEYIIFDACLMGGVEVAYELADVTDLIGFSQAEVAGDGFYYKKMLQRLLQENNPQAVIEDTWQYYQDKGSYSVVSCVKPKNMEALAQCCATLTDKYRQQLYELDKDDVQQFYTGSHPWFFDLKEVFQKCGATRDEMDELQQKLNLCVTYCAYTDHIRHMVDVHTNCGFSMYLPQYGTERLQNYYRTLAWNEATGLVE